MIPESQAQPGKFFLEAPASREMAVGGWSLPNTVSKRSMGTRKKNESDKSVTYAPWEISRVPAEGVVSYPTGSGIYGSGSCKSPTVTERNDFTWGQYDEQTAPESQKLYADASDGWLASLTDRKLFVKSFPDIAICSLVKYRKLGWAWHCQAPTETGY